MTKINKPEYVVLVDDQDNEIGTAEKMAAHENNQLHRAFSVFIFREKPTLELLLQQRAMGKYHSPGSWTNTCCSHPRQGEAIIEAGQRRLMEEFGINASLNDIGHFHYNAHFPNGLSENEIDHVLIGTVPHTLRFKFNPEEIHDYRWITIEDLQREMGEKPELFTPWLAQALNIVIQRIHTP